MAGRALSRALALGCLFVLGACSGNGVGTGPFGNGPQPCNPGTQVTLAQPYPPGQTGVPTTIGQIIIVANGSTNTLHDNPSVWTVILNSTSGLTNGSVLNPVPFPNGPHPYPSDFYYAANIPTLTPGVTYTVFLTRTDGTCQAANVGSFST
ncbi:MAG: hypothetical protein JO233_01555 [Candidatus Eremiobacteraeota bacterium]|nr:hypothetical protein [Candidatus Eremiobacteraeota bacterium]